MEGTREAISGNMAKQLISHVSKYNYEVWHLMRWSSKRSLISGFGVMQPRAYLDSWDRQGGANVDVSTVISIDLVHIDEDSLEVPDILTIAPATLGSFSEAGMSTTKSSGGARTFRSKQSMSIISLHSWLSCSKKDAQILPQVFVRIDVTLHTLVLLRYR
ncbi:hypothetical protein Salat_1907800 [Sesamum alatum]|uniref:Uncharacterized protein n=1 Tax=Sesamum alatum TaxID=300844 RepID=A0AAE1Y3T5_9LAMI|nr:hypothetical protein Salat_1907800 [Sesamum alatum]